MSKRPFGGLADLAKILEEASNPESELREDRKETKPKVALRKGGVAKPIRAIDPKRMAWYQKRLKDQEEKSEVPRTEVEIVVPEGPAKQVTTKAAASSLSASVMDSLKAAAQASNKPKQDGAKQRPEAWKRKPGDPIF